jgi:hypothetical protein
MNQRIRELMDEAVRFRLDPDSRQYEAQVSPEDLEMFAQLIVAKVLDEVSTRAYVSGDRAWSDDADRPWIELEFGYGKLHDAQRQAGKRK